LTTDGEEQEDYCTVLQ